MAAIKNYYHDEICNQGTEDDPEQDPEYDGQPDELQENEDFAHDGEFENMSAENERLKSRNISLDRRYFNEGLERAAEIVDSFVSNDGYPEDIRSDLLPDAIRAEIK